MGRNQGPNHLPTMTHALSIGRYQLAININRKLGRPKKTSFVRLKEAIAVYERLLKDRRFSGHPLSRVFRRLFENKKARRFFGINLTVAALFVGTLMPPPSAFSYHPPEITSLDSNVVQITTENSIRSPTGSLEITQGYHFFHPGIDLNGDFGDPVFPMMNGVVEETALGRFGYGNYIIINHNGARLKSLYAHLAKITVKKEEEVDKNTVIGTIGRTGWATGSHLHFEVWENGQPINPLTILR